VSRIRSFSQKAPAQKGDVEINETPQKSSEGREAGRDRAEGQEMSEMLSLSIFTIEADRKPIFAFAAKRHQEAEAFCADETVLTKLRSVRSGGIPLCNTHSIFRVRLATPDERALYNDRTKWRSSIENRAAAFLVDVDEP
jgi:hypothetical protein